LIDLLHVLGRLVLLETKQAAWLETICISPLLTRATLDAAGALVLPKPIDTWQNTWMGRTICSRARKCDHHTICSKSYAKRSCAGWWIFTVHVAVTRKT
jgi:hypothetical protein